MSNTVVTDELLTLLRTDGISATRRATGLAKSTLGNIAKKHGIDTSTKDPRYLAGIQAARLTWELRRAELPAHMGEVAELALECVEEAILAKDAKAAKEFATTMAILIDKCQVLTGGATQRIDNMDAESLRARIAELDKGASK